jgi:hypothetical protein
MSRHTPGPWVWDGHTLKPANAAPDVSAVHSILDAEGGFGYLMSDHKATLAELDADRRLIAAAPELLAALQALLTQYRMVVGLTDQDDDAYTVDACTAIARATET